MRTLSSERLSGERVHSDTVGSPVPESPSEQPPVIRRAEVVAFALIGLLIISIGAVLYFAKAFFLPVVLAFTIGTMLSPAASFLERYKIPRPVGATLIVTALGAAMAFMVGLISSPLMDKRYQRLVPDYDVYRTRAIPASTPAGALAPPADADA